MSEMFVPPGILSAVSKICECDETSAREKIGAKIRELKKVYAEESFSLLVWSEFDRYTLHVATQNYMFSSEIHDRMLQDIEICDEVVLKLANILAFAFSVDKLHKLISRVENFVEKLNASCRAAFGEMLRALIKWSSEGIPEKRSVNDEVLIKTYEEAKGSIPIVVNPKHHRAYIVDRLERLNKIRISCGDSK